MKLIDYKVCNSDKVYEGYLTPRMMCAGYLQGGERCVPGEPGAHGPIRQGDAGRTGLHAFPVCWCPLAGYRQRGISCLLSSLLCPSVLG